MIERKTRSLIVGRPTVLGIDRMWFWISGARRSSPSICVTRALMVPSRRAMVTLVGHFAGREQRPAREGLAQQLSHPGCPGLLRLHRLVQVGRDGAYHRMGEHPVRQGADVAFFESLLVPQGDRNPLCAVAWFLPQVQEFRCEMHDPEPDLRLREAGPAVSVE